MTNFPARLLSTAYLAAGIAAVAFWSLGLGVVGGLLVFWLGGAVAVLGLGFLPAFAVPEREHDRNLVTADEWRRWDADLAAERAKVDRAA